MTKAEDFEAETTSRGEELKALAMAKKAVKDNTGGATDQQYSFLQTSSDTANFEVVRMVKDLARKQHAPELAQLASRLSSAIRLNHGADVFAKLSTKLNAAESTSAKLKEETAQLQKELAEL